MILEANRHVSVKTRAIAEGLDGRVLTVYIVNNSIGGTFHNYM